MPAPALPRVLAYGQTIESDFPFRTRMPASDQPSTLRFDWRDFPPDWLSAAPLLYRSRRRRPDGASAVQLHQKPEGIAIRLPRQAEFLMSGATITAGPSSPDARDSVEINFFGVALPLWLEQRGSSVLHAAGVATGGRSIGLLADTGGGKTTLALELLRQGWSLVADDHLAVEANPLSRSLPRVWPAVPEVRLSQEQLERLQISAGSLLPVGADSPKFRVPVEALGAGFAGTPQELAVLYLLERQAGLEEITIEALAGTEALQGLLRYSAAPLLCEALGLGPQRLDRLTHLVRAIPVRRLVVPDSVDRLGAVAQRLKGELDALATQRQ